MEILDGLAQLMLSADGRYAANTRYPLAEFALSSSVMGSVVVLLDWLMTRAGRGSALQLIYRGPNVILLLLFWGAGAGLAGFIGASFGILQISRAASITVGVAWPLVLPRVLKATEETEVREDFSEKVE